MKKIVIIGAGASGMFFALNINTDKYDVTILEKNKTVGKKLLMTGNGKCNFWNDDMNINHFHSSENLDNIITNDLILEVPNKIDNLGIEKKCKNGYYYPFTNKASTIKDTFLEEIENKNIKIIYNYDVNSLKKEEDGYLINNEIHADIVILSTGGLTYPKTGSNGDGLNILKSLGHDIVKPLPSLVQLITKKENYLKVWHGIREDAKVSLYIDDKLIKSEEGELQLTDYGISGICVFNISRDASIALDQKRKVNVKIDFMSFCDNVKTFLKEKNTNLSVLSVLKRIINEALAKIILDESHIKYNVLVKNLSDKELTRLETGIKEFNLEIVNTKSFDSAQVTRGGVSLKDINSRFESKKCKNLYIIGEALDVDGDCGGYNLAFAFMSAYRASKGLNND